jgi:hypothetical protein
VCFLLPSAIFLVAAIQTAYYTITSSNLLCLETIKAYSVEQNSSQKADK